LENQGFQRHKTSKKAIFASQFAKSGYFWIIGFPPRSGCLSLFRDRLWQGAESGAFNYAFQINIVRSVSCDQPWSAMVRQP